MDEFIQQVDNLCPPNCIKVLVGNKCDLEQERKVSFADACEYAELQGMTKFFETSACNFETVEQMFTWCANELAKDS